MATPTSLMTPLVSEPLRVSVPDCTPGIGTLRSWVVVVPPGIAHGYKVIGTEPAGLIYVTSRCYDPTDEGRIPYDDSRLNYDWELQHK